MDDRLQQAIDVALASVRQHPAGALLPGQRDQIYKLLGPLYIRKGRCIRTQLAVIAARRALPIWHQERPDDFRVDQLLDLAVAQAERPFPDEAAQEKAGEAWDWLDQTKELSLDAFRVMAAALEAVYVSIGTDRFLDVTIDENTTDDDLDPWCSDTAKYAAVVLTGPVWKSVSSPEARQAFWEWWLTEAIPGAIASCVTENLV